MAMTLQHATGAELRLQARQGKLDGPTPGLAMGYVQANLVVVPRDLAFDFLLFCQRNPRPCPLLDVTEPGSAEPRLVAPRAVWREDFVGFLLGCSFTFENALLQAGLPVRHLDEGRNVPMYRTHIPC